MDCREDLIFNDDNCRTEEKAKESILLMKKKMLRSHELILQYNNKLKECERLKCDLSIVQEEANKLKRDNNTNLSKVVKLELQSIEHKKCREDLERKLADKDDQIAGDKCHLQQLVCKVEDIEDKHSEKLMEVELEKSSLEGKVKSLEQELKALRKSHATELAKLEKPTSNVPPKTRKGAIKFVRETKEIGVNTSAEVEPAKIVKISTMDKCTLTNEFYHITDNPYPIFCDKCESLTEPSVEKICKIMTAHPPIVTEMVSPIRRREMPRANVPRSCPNPNASNSSILNSKHNDFYSSSVNPKETNLNEFNRVDPISNNFVSPIDPMLPNVQLTNSARPLDTSTPEIENLRRKVEILERKIKKRKKKENLDAQLGSASCCSHSRTVNCCSHGQAHANPAPNVFSNVQTDMMTEFWNRLMKFTEERASKVESPQKPKKRTKLKLRRLKRGKIRSTKKLKNCGSTNWAVESDACETQNLDDSATNNSHILRINPSNVDSKECSPVKTQSNREDEFTEKETQMEDSSNRASPVKVPDKPKNKRRKRYLMFGDDEDDATIGTVSLKNEVIENLAQTSNSEFPTTETEDLSISAIASNSMDAEFSSSGISENFESSYFSQNSVINVSTSISREAVSQANSRDSNFKKALPNKESAFDVRNDSQTSDLHKDFPIRRRDKSVSVYADADVSDTPNEESFEADLQDSSTARKRKRSSSPIATRRSTRSNLLGKLRALKKNTTMGVANTRSTSCHETRLQRRLRNESETEEHEAKRRETDHASSVSESEPDPRVPVKKQRIAHIPKKDTEPEEQESSRMRKLRQVAKQICQNPGEKTTKRGRPRRSTLNKSKSMSLEQPAITEEVVESSALSEASPNSNVDNLSLAKPLGAQSLILKPVINDSVEVYEPPQKQSKVLKDIVSNNHDNEMRMEITEANPFKENNRAHPNYADKKLTSIKTKLTESLESSDARCDEIDKAGRRITSETPLNDITESSAILDSGKMESCAPKAAETLTIATESITDSNRVAEDAGSVKDQSEKCSTSKETSEVTPARVPPTVTEEIDSPASPASNSSLDIPQSSPLKIPVSPTRSPIKSPKRSITLQAQSLHEQTLTNIAPIANPTEATSSPKDLPNFTESILFTKLTEKRGPSDVHSDSFVSPLAVPADVAQSGDSPENSRQFTSHKLPAVIVARPTSRLRSVKQRSSMYDNVLLPPAVEVPATSLPDNLATLISSNVSGSLPIDVPKRCDTVETNLPVSRSMEVSGRSLVVYDANLHEDSDAIFDTESVPSPDTVVDTQDVKKIKKPTKKKKKKKPSNKCTEAINVVKELRSRQVLSSPSADANQRNRSTKNTCTETIGHVREIVGPVTLFNRYMGECLKKSRERKMRNVAATKLQEESEKTVKCELDKLVESEEWTSELHQSVITALREIPSKRTVAKCIVDLLVERASLGEPLDRTYTPPAPVMTKTQQRIAALINGLNRDGIMPGVFELVQDGIGYTVFRLGRAPEMEVLEGLFRIFTAIARMKKDRERVRILCCDTIYCLGRKAHSLINIVLTVWPEVFPMHGTSEGEIPNCIAHLIKSDTSPKAAAAKRLITSYYMYPQFQARSGAVMTGLLQALKTKYSGDLEAAILLLAKAEGTDWANDNILNGGLMEIIHDNNYSSSFDALSLLGFILRTFPLEDTQNVTKEIVEQLFKMIESDGASSDQREGVVSALLSLSRRNSDFVRIADTVLSWKPSQTLRERTVEQMNAFFKMRNPVWWNERQRLAARKSSMASENK